MVHSDPEVYTFGRLAVVVDGSRRIVAVALLGADSVRMLSRVGDVYKRARGKLKPRKPETVKARQLRRVRARDRARSAPG